MRRAEQTSAAQPLQTQLEAIGIWGLSPRPLGNFWAKNSHFSAIGITLRTFLKPFERAKSLKFESRLKELNFPTPTVPNLTKSPSLKLA